MPEIGSISREKDRVAAFDGSDRACCPALRGERRHRAGGDITSDKVAQTLRMYLLEVYTPDIKFDEVSQITGWP